MCGPAGMSVHAAAKQLWRILRLYSGRCAGLTSIVASASALNRTCLMRARPLLTAAFDAPHALHGRRCRHITSGCGRRWAGRGAAPPG